MRSPRDRGSASIWVLSFAGLILVVAFVVVLRSSAVLARHRAESAADLAALAAAARIGIANDECEVAAKVALTNGAIVSDCRLIIAADGRSGTVRLRIQVDITLPLRLGARTVAAEAAAARLVSN